MLRLNINVVHQCKPTVETIHSPEFWFQCLRERRRPTLSQLCTWNASLSRLRSHPTVQNRWLMERRTLDERRTDDARCTDSTHQRRSSPVHQYRTSTLPPPKLNLVWKSKEADCGSSDRGLVCFPKIGWRQHITGRQVSFIWPTLSAAYRIEHNMQPRRKCSHSIIFGGEKSANKITNALHSPLKHPQLQSHWQNNTLPKNSTSITDMPDSGTTSPSTPMSVYSKDVDVV